MMPFSAINDGDLFANPLWVHCNPPGNIYRVEEINRTEKMIKIQTYNGRTCTPFGKPFWTKNTNRMFSESWRYA